MARFNILKISLENLIEVQEELIAVVLKQIPHIENHDVEGLYNTYSQEVKLIKTLELLKMSLDNDKKLLSESDDDILNKWKDSVTKLDELMQRKKNLLNKAMTIQDSLYEKIIQATKEVMEGGRYHKNNLSTRFLEKNFISLVSDELF